MKWWSLPVLILGLSTLWSGTHSATCAKDGACDATLQAWQTEHIMLTILDQLPDVGMGATSPDQIMDPELKKFYQEIQADISEKYSRDKNAEFLFLDAEDPSAGEDRSQFVAAFNMSADLKGMVVVEALLHVATSLPSFEQHSVHEVNVQVFEKKTDMSLGELVTTATFLIKGSQRISIQLPVDAVKRWFTDGKIGGLFVSAMVKDHNIVVHPQQAISKADTMILQVVSRDPRYGISKPSRTRRSATPVCTENNPSKGCCLYDMQISFEKVGWGWVVAPHRYDAFVCKGNCKLNSHHYLNDYGHSKIMRSYSLKFLQHDEELNKLGFCCHPTEYDYIKLIYVNRDGKVTLANVNGMVARRCGCA
ncbi:hypothetical protein GCK72_011869 [Caenorhabditis remanei]|uniref:CRE-DAF-7 protein n=1 Tax=Caenorhabditis remanei TaxID=31234 RepID=E3ML81_CAERE|nr:hypothetical protein GCK72_011869 [Caenorhabditis remanei]EFP04382.1 CRE-DAF-7 protein [Caenorhabditis remanei]KAF1763602.1 hypothetical protein GCK72_011869 [Caenorhabditis remanei]